MTENGPAVEPGCTGDWKWSSWDRVYWGRRRYSLVSDPWSSHFSEPTFLSLGGVGLVLKRQRWWDWWIISRWCLTDLLQINPSKYFFHKKNNVPTMWLQYDACYCVPDPFCLALQSKGLSHSGEKSKKCDQWHRNQKVCLCRLRLLFCRVIPPCPCPCHLNHFLHTLFSLSILLFSPSIPDITSRKYDTCGLGDWNHLQFRIEGHSVPHPTFTFTTHPLSMICTMMIHLLYDIAHIHNCDNR